jgi:hypothetical protein
MGHTDGCSSYFDGSFEVFEGLFEGVEGDFLLLDEGDEFFVEEVLWSSI